MKPKEVKKKIKIEECRECQLLTKEVKFLKDLVDSLLIQRGALPVTMKPEEAPKEDPKEVSGKEEQIKFGEG